MFVLKRAEALMTGVDISEITQQKMPFFRKKLAAELYNWGKKKLETGYISDPERIV